MKIEPKNKRTKRIRNESERGVESSQWNSRKRVPRSERRFPANTPRESVMVVQRNSECRDGPLRIYILEDGQRLASENEVEYHSRLRNQSIVCDI